MKLQAQSSKALSIALQKAMKCYNTKNTIAILSNVLISQKDKGQFYFTTATSDSQLTIPAPLTIVGGTFQKPVAVSPDILVSFLSTLPDCTVTFDFADNCNTLTASYCTSVGDNVKEGKVSLTYVGGEDFPFMSQPGKGALYISLPETFLADVTSKSQKFVSDHELRPVMQCLVMDVAQDFSEIVCVATNGNMLIKTNHSNDPQRGGSNFYRSGAASTILIHSAYFRSLSAFEGCEDVDIESDGANIRMSADGVEFVCKNVEGRFPNYDSVIPKNNPYYVSFDKKEMLSVLKRIAIFGDTNSNLVVLKMDGMFLDVSAKNVDFSREAEDQVTVINSQCQDGFRIGFSSKTLTECISALPGDTIRMQLSDPARPAVLTADEPSPASLTLCMPMVIE